MLAVLPMTVLVASALRSPDSGPLVRALVIGAGLAAGLGAYAARRAGTPPGRLTRGTLPGRLTPGRLTPRGRFRAVRPRPADPARTLPGGLTRAS